MKTFKLSLIIAIISFLTLSVLTKTHNGPFTYKYQMLKHKIPYETEANNEIIRYDEEDKYRASKKVEQAARREMDFIEDEQDENPKLTRSADYEMDKCDNDEEKCKSEKRTDFRGSGNSKETSNIALKAAQEAKAAEEAQEVAGKEASKKAKFELAQKSIQAAKAAQAALSAKKSILEELEREVREAEMVVQDLSSSIQQSEENSQAALRAYQQAQTQLKMLSELLQVAQSTVANGEQAAQGSQQELNEKTQLLEAAKSRVEKLLRELKVARTDFTNTKKEAYKASMAAKEAKQNAARV